MLCETRFQNHHHETPLSEELRATGMGLWVQHVENWEDESYKYVVRICVVLLDVIRLHFPHTADAGEGTVSETTSIELIRQVGDGWEAVWEMRVVIRQ